MRASHMRRLLALACLICLSILLANAIRPAAARALAQADTTTGLVGRWPNGVGANPTVDTSGNARHAAEPYAFTNSAPDAAADTYAATEDTTLIVAAPGVLANDSDPDGDSLAATLITAPTNGTIQLTANGSFVYTPTANFSGTDTFSYMAFDNANLAPSGYWPFDDGANPTADASGNGHAGTLLNGAAFTTNVPISLTSGTAMSFDGSNDRVDVGEIDLANRSFTVALWASRSTLNSGNNYVVGQGTGGNNSVLHIGFRGNNRFTCAFYNNDLDTSAAYTDTDWHHWACTYDSLTRQRTIYRDGVAVASATAPAHYQGTGTLSIGSRGGGADPFPGLIDDVKIYDQALSAAAVATAMDTAPGTGAADAATVTISVSAVNDAPVAADDTYATTENTTLTVAAPGVLANDSDPDSDSLAATLTTAPAHGAVQLTSDSSFAYTPTANFVGQDTFSYIASDGVLTDTAVVTLTVTPAACFVETSGDGLTDFVSLDASALQRAADAASPGATLKVAGICAGVQQSAGLSQTLSIDKNLTIQGGYIQTAWLDAPDPDLHPTILDAVAGGRVVRVAGSVAATLDGLQIRNGRVNNGAGLFLESGAVVTATATLFANNTATQDGGAIANSGGTLTIRASTFTDNATAQNGTIYASTSAWTSVTASSFYTNTAQRGGGLFVNTGGAADVANSTFAYNQTDEGGGIASRGTLTVTHSTFGYNSADLGGAIHNWNGTLYLYNALSGANSGGPECLNEGTLAASVANLIDDGSCGATWTERPGLAGLGDHGGATWTIALSSDSLAIDNAASAHCPAADQRGVLRPQGVACDGGAYEAAQVAVALSIAGTGVGTIVSTPPGQACSAACTISFVQGAVITLTATPATGSAFAGWGGACSGSGPCVVTMDAARSVSATFTLNQYALAVTLAGTGSGAVTSAPTAINCGQACSATLDHGTVITLTATPAAGSAFSGWGGACSGTGPCVVTMDAARNVSATFDTTTVKLMLPLLLR